MWAWLRLLPARPGGTANPRASSQKKIEGATNQKNWKPAGDGVVYGRCLTPLPRQWRAEDRMASYLDLQSSDVHETAKMVTRLEKPLKREIEIDGQAFIVTITPRLLTLVGKGRRKGVEIRWNEMISGEAALAKALQASIVDPNVRLEPSVRNVRRRPSRKHR
jgi:hypothetical protein